MLQKRTKGSSVRLRAEGLTWQQVGDEIIVLDLEGSNYLKLNSTGATLWKALAEGSDQVELITLVIQEFGVSEDEATRDVIAFLSDLEAEELLDRD